MKTIKITNKITDQEYNCPGYNSIQIKNNKAIIECGMSEGYDCLYSKLGYPRPAGIKYTFIDSTLGWLRKYVYEIDLNIYDLGIC